MAEKELDVIVKGEAQNAAALDEFTSKTKELDGAVKSVHTTTAAANVTLDEHAKKTHAAAAEEHLITAESRESAKAMGELGAKGGELFERFTALTSAAGGLQGTMTGGLLLGLGAVAEGVMKVNETYQEQEHASENLKQAVLATLSPYQDQGRALEDVNSRFEEFAKQNASFIDNQNNAKDALANFIRAGFDTDQAMEALGVTLDLAGIKQEDLATASNQVLLMMEGQGRVAKSLGIDIAALKGDDESAAAAHKDFATATQAVTTAQDGLAAAQKRQRDAAEALKKTQDELAGKHQLTAVQADTLHQAEQRVADTTAQVKDASDKLTTAQGNLRDAQDKVNNSVSIGTQVLDQLKQKTDGGRDSMDKQAQAEHDLSAQWDAFASKTGPDVNYAWLVILGTLEGILELLNDIPAAAEAAWKAISPGGGQAQVIKGRTEQMNGSGGISNPAPSGGGGMGGGGGELSAVTQQNVFNIQANDPEGVASAVAARLVSV